MPEPTTHDHIVDRLHRLYADEPDVEVRTQLVDQWLSCMNPDLGLASPLELIRRGRSDEVLELVEDLLEWARVFEDDDAATS